MTCHIRIIREPTELNWHDTANSGTCRYFGHGHRHTSELERLSRRRRPRYHLRRCRLNTYTALVHATSSPPSARPQRTSSLASALSIHLSHASPCRFVNIYGGRTSSSTCYDLYIRHTMLIRTLSYRSHESLSIRLSYETAGWLFLSWLRRLISNTVTPRFCVYKPALPPPSRVPCYHITAVICPPHPSGALPYCVMDKRPNPLNTVPSPRAIIMRAPPSSDRLPGSPPPCPLLRTACQSLPSSPGSLPRLPCCSRSRALLCSVTSNHVLPARLGNNLWKCIPVRHGLFLPTLSGNCPHWFFPRFVGLTQPRALRQCRHIPSSLWQIYQHSSH